MTDQQRDEALSREHWTVEQWERWRDERLAFVLHRAATRVPYYREQWAARRRKGDKRSAELLENWPLLEKETLRENPEAFVADDRSIYRMFHDHTSGTTGKSLDLWLSRNTVQSWYALFEARCRHWNGLSRNDRWAIIGGQLVTAVEQEDPPFWVWNALLHQLYLSAYHIAPRSAKSYVEALRRYDIRYLVGYPSAIHVLARAILTQGISVPNLACILVNAEPLLESQRQDMSQAFGCPVRETYGMAEIVMAASECAHGRMHRWPEAGELELINQDLANQNARVGEFVCTGLLNSDMPLIRYRVGDREAVASPSASCACGRTLPILDAIEGRVDDVLFTRDGRAIGRLDPIFKSGLAIQEAQIVQDTLDHIRVRYVAAPGFTQRDSSSLIARIRERMGPVGVALEAIDSIPRSSNGKFRAVICNLPPEDRIRIQSLT